MRKMRCESYRKCNVKKKEKKKKKKEVEKGK